MFIEEEVIERGKGNGKQQIGSGVNDTGVQPIMINENREYQKK